MKEAMNRGSIFFREVGVRACGLLGVGVSLSLCAVGESEASLMISQPSQRFEIDFDSTVTRVNVGAFAGRGIVDSPTEGQLDAAAWEVVGFSSESDLERGKSHGGVSTGGLYAFTTTPMGVDENVILGVQPTASDFTPGAITLSVQNLTGDTVSEWDIDYLVYWLNNGSRSTSIGFAYSTGQAFQTVPSLELVTPGAPTPGVAWSSSLRAARLKAHVEHGEFLSLRWRADDRLGSGSRDEFGIDSIGVMAVRNASSVPEPADSVALTWLLVLPAAIAGRFRRRRGCPPPM